MPASVLIVERSYLERVTETWRVTVREDEVPPGSTNSAVALSKLGRDGSELVGATRVANAHAGAPLEPFVVRVVEGDP